MSWRGAILAVLLLGVLSDVTWLWNDAVVPWDSKNHFYPMFRFLGEQLNSGTFPLWNPYHFAGHPTAADPQSLLFSPTMLLFAFLAPHASMQLFDAVIMAHLTLGGLGILALFHRRNWAPAGGILAAAIFILGVSASSRLQHTGMILSFSFFPWALWSLETASAKRSYLHGLLFGVVAALMAQGRDQVAYLFCLWLIATLIYEVISAEKPLIYLQKRILLIVLMGAVGAALLAVPVLLTMQFLAQSNRPGIPYGVAAEGSLSLVNLVTLIIPNFFGSLDWNYDYWGPGYETIEHGDWTDRAINYLFVGTVPTLLLVWHGILGRRLADKQIRLFTLILIFVFFYAIGRVSPVFEVIFDHLPGVSLYRRPADATFALQLCLGILSGYLLNEAFEKGSPNLTPDIPRVFWLGLGGSAIVIILVLALQFSIAQGHIGQSMAAVSLSIILVAGAIYLLRQSTHRPLIFACLALFTCGELVLRDGASSLNSEPAKVYAPYATLTPDFKKGLDSLLKEIAARHDKGEYPRVEILGLNGPWMNASMVYGLENTLGYNPLRIAPYERAIGPGDNSGDVTLRHYPANFRGYGSILAKLLGLEYLVLDRPLPKLPRHIPRPIATLLYGTEGMYIYKLRPASPRAYFATTIRIVDSEAVTDGDAIPDFDRNREVLLDEANAQKPSQNYQQSDKLAASNANVSIKAMHTNSSTIEVDTDQPGLLVLHDIYYPGWRATVDEVPSPILRANILFRAVEVPAGHHVVRFEYAPFSKENLKAAVETLLPAKDPN